MTRPPTRFLHRSNYRRRRMADAARLLPLAGAILLMMPLLIAGDPTVPGVYDPQSGAPGPTPGTAPGTAPIGASGGSGPQPGGSLTSRVGLYVFAVWAILIALAFALSRGLRDDRAVRSAPMASDGTPTDARPPL